MNKRIGSVLGVLAIALAVIYTGTALALDVKKPQASPLAAKEFNKPELHISTSNLAMDEAPTTLSSRGAWSTFAARYGQPQVYLDPRSGTATSVMTRIPMIPGWGDGNQLGLTEVSTALGRKVTRIDSAVVADLMRRFVVDNAGAIGVDVAQLGSANAVQVADTLWNVRIPQVYNGIAVRYGHMVAVINNGNLVILGTETWGNVTGLNTRPEINEDDAMNVGWSYIGGRGATDSISAKPSLQIIPVAPQEFQTGEAFSGPIGSGYRHRLVWAFGIQRMGDDAQWEILVDAHSGEVLSFEDQNQYETKSVTGGVYPLTDTEICPSNDRCGTMFPNYPMPYADTGLASPNNFTNSAGLFNYTSGNVTTTFTGKYVKITDTCGPVSAAAAGDIALGGTNGQHDCTSAGFSAGNTPASRSAFYEVNKLMEQARGWIPGNAWLNAQMVTNVNLTQTCNAFYSPTNGTINFYRSGGGCRNTGEIAAVFDHEWGHALDDNDSGGALSVSSEGYADIAAIYRLQASCVGYGFFQTLNDGCGTTSDGTGFNANESLTGTHCTLDCSGVRDADWDKHADHVPDTPANFSCAQCSSGSGPCGRQVHCDAAPTRQAAWDLVARDLRTAPFNYSSDDAFLVGNKIFFQGSGTIGNWHTCTCPSTSDGCGATNAYLSWLAADDDNGNLADGTPHMTAIRNAFNRHNMACATPTPQNSGCAGGPTQAPTLQVATGSNSLNLSWTAVPGATSYRVLRSEGYAGCNFGKAVIATVPGLSYTDPDVANGRPAYYVVQAVGASGACFGPVSTCVTGTPQPCAGSISLTQDLYNCSGAPLNITMIDGDLVGTGTANVSISSNTEGVAETLALAETPANSGVFKGTFGTTTSAPVHGDGQISIADGDTIAVGYLDADYCGTPNFLVEKFAAVDCSTPIISNVQIVNITGNAADVTFDTNEPTGAVAHFGTTPPPSGTASNPALGLTHTVHLSGLTGCTAFLVSVDASDPAGNSATDNNSGAYYGFITLANVTPNFPSTDTPKPIPDVRTPPVLSTIVVPNTESVVDVNVTINITHTYDDDLDIFLIGPNGTRVELSTDNGNSGGDNFVNTVFDDQAATSITAGTAPFTGSFRPEGSLATLNGIPANGNWTLEITDDANIDSGTLNSWSIQLTFPPAQCPTVGQVTLDQTSYQCNETAQIHVVDFSILNQGTQAVTVTSGAEPGGETVILNETPANSGSFIGTIALATLPASGGDGYLSVTDGDTMTVTYIDADDGYGGMNIPRTDTALIDCSGPAISNVQAVNVTGRDADITWSTNENADSEVWYGTAPPPTSTVSSAASVTSHSIHLSGLTPCTPYVYYVRSTDVTSNSTVGDNGGVYFSFTTSADTQPVFSYSGAAVPIPDNNTTGVLATINVTDVREILDVNVQVNITHPNVGDLQLFLVSPNNIEIALATNRGGTGDNFTNTVFDDAAAGPISGGTAPFTGSFKPEVPLSQVNGILSNGNWSLKVKDVVAANTGTIASWQLRPTYPAVACNTPFVQEASHSVADSCSVGGSNSIVDPGEDLSIPVQLVNTGYAGATGVVATLSTVTPDVVILDGSVTYGTLALGAFSTGDGPFLVSIGSTVPCGTLITFNLAVSANEGAWSDSFTVQVGNQPIGTTNYPSTDTPKPLPDLRTPVLSTIAVASAGLVSDVNVTINITHTFDGDLDIFLIGPNGTRVELTTDNGSTGDNYVNTVFDDQAATSITAGVAPFTGSFKPEGSLATLNGIPANGNWTLEITDDANLDSGTLNSWTLTITNPAGGYQCTSCSPAAPSEDTTLNFTSKTAAAWSAASGASAYYLYRGLTADLPQLMTASDDSCQAGVTAGTSMGSISDPPAGVLHWYLVRGWNGGGYGPAGDATAGPRLQSSYGACP